VSEDLVLTGGGRVVQELSDAELVARCRDEGGEAWNVLVERFSRYVYAICTQGFDRGRSDAEDVFQEVFEKVYTRLDRLRDAEAIRPWIAQLTRRACIDRFRSQGRELASDALEPDGVDDLLTTLDDALDVRSALEALPENCQEILDRFFARDESYRTIGEALELPAGTIASRISRCLERLKEAMEEKDPEARLVDG
jgi:RNA polymerase sigma-70 factor (ECF subfamily)